MFHKMLQVNSRRLFTRPRYLLYLAIGLALVYLMVLQPASGAYRVIPWDGLGWGHKEEPPPPPPAEVIEEKPKEELDPEKRYANELRAEFEAEERSLGRMSGMGNIYGNTLASLIEKTERKAEFEAALKPSPNKTSTSAYTSEEPFVYDPYPAYNSAAWRAGAGSHGADYVACNGPDGHPVEDILVFKGRPDNFPREAMGSYDALGMDGSLCFERESRLGPYGLKQEKKKRKGKPRPQPELEGLGVPDEWDRANWGHLQQECLQKNKARYDLKGTPSKFMNGPYNLKAELGDLFLGGIPDEELKKVKKPARRSLSRSRAIERRGLLKEEGKRAASSANETETGTGKPESRTALLLRSYTGKKYQENDKQIIRSLISELALKSGGQYHIYLLVHVRDASLNIWESDEDYHTAIATIPREFHGMTILWNDEAVQAIYPKLVGRANSVHNAQWLPVQKFSQDHPEYDFIWNWEMDSRLTGHHYDFLEKLGSWAKRQPRRGLWERSSRYYIPSIHGDYDTTFRTSVAERYWNKDSRREETVWGPAPLPGEVKPVGPKPPFSTPDKDKDYTWGVGEDADVLTLGPIVDPVGSGWVNRNDVWGYGGADKTPRRVTIITQSRVSKTLLDIMHVENLRGNHVASEMTPQTVALLHGLKAAAAPMPVFFDRMWPGQSLEKWFNRGERGDSGGRGSAMAWGLEGRYRGSTWYYRAAPPQRLYLNWMGFEDSAIGGDDWEASHGRPCLPPFFLHPIKDVVETPEGFESESKLPYK